MPRKTEMQNPASKQEQQAEDGADQQASVQTVRMTRDPDLNPAPHEADVHPDEVDHWVAAGWSVA